MLLLFSATLLILWNTPESNGNKLSNEDYSWSWDLDRGWKFNIKFLGVDRITEETTTGESLIIPPGNHDTIPVPQYESLVKISSSWTIEEPVINNILDNGEWSLNSFYGIELKADYIAEIGFQAKNNASHLFFVFIFHGETGEQRIVEFAWDFSSYTINLDESTLDFEFKLLKEEQDYVTRLKVMKLHLMSYAAHEKLEAEEELLVSDALGLKSKLEPRNRITTNDPYSIYGTVKHADGSVVDGATVTVYNRDDGNYNDTTVTNAIGQYIFDLADFSDYSNGDEIFVEAVKNEFHGANGDYVNTSLPGSLLNVSIYHIVIDEYFYDSSASADKDEYVVLHNPSAYDINMTGFIISDGEDDAEFPNYTLSAGAYVIATKCADKYYSERYSTYPDFEWDPEGIGGAPNNATIPDLIDADDHIGEVNSLTFGNSGDEIYISDSYPAIFSLDAVVYEAYVADDLPERTWTGTVAPVASLDYVVQRIDPAFEGTEINETNEELDSNFHAFERTAAPPLGYYAPELPTWGSGLIIVTIVSIIVIPLFNRRKKQRFSK